MKALFEAAAVVVAGALLGTVLVKALPHGRFQDLLAKDISAGLHPTNLDLKLVDLTFGCMFHLNVASIAGILAAAFLYKTIVK